MAEYHSQPARWLRTATEQASAEGGAPVLRSRAVAARKSGAALDPGPSVPPQSLATQTNRLRPHACHAGRSFTGKRELTKRAAPRKSPAQLLLQRRPAPGQTERDGKSRVSTARLKRLKLGDTLRQVRRCGRCRCLTSSHRRFSLPTQALKLAPSLEHG